MYLGMSFSSTVSDVILFQEIFIASGNEYNRTVPGERIWNL
jgi:hypothetical protein